MSIQGGLRWVWPWAQRDLLRQFVQRQLLARYRGTVFGVAWSLLSPMLMMSVYTLVFREVFGWKWAGSDGGGLDFALRVFAGLTVFGFVADVLMRAPQLVVEQPNLVKKVPFPLHLLVWTNTFSSLLAALPGLGLLVLACAAFGVTPSWAWLSLPLIWLPLLPMLLGLGWALAAIGVYLRDINQLLGLALSLLQFLSPVFYPLEAVSQRMRPLFWLNPLTPVIEQSRAALFHGGWPSFQLLAVQMGLGLGLAALGAWLFSRLRPGFADVL